MAALNGLADLFGISARSWDRARGGDLGPPVFTALGAWLIMAWSRFGFQGVSAPRAAVRFMLIGFYAWMGLALLLWLASKLIADSNPNSSPSPDPAPDPVPDPVTLIRLTGLAHRPLVVIGLVLQVTGFFLPTPGVGLVVAVAGLALWMPAMLVGALIWARPRPIVRAAAVVALPYLVWLAVVARFLDSQIGHLL